MLFKKTIHDPTLSFVMHVFCIQETWLCSGIYFTIPCCTVLQKDRSGDVRLGRCALFIHSSLTYKDLGITSSMECGVVELMNELLELNSVFLNTMGLLFTFLQNFRMFGYHLLISKSGGVVLYSIFATLL